jgi:hypothetical protein
LSSLHQPVLAVDLDPVLLGTWPGYSAGVTVRGGYAYVAARDAGLVIIDVQDPTNPRQVGATNTSGDTRFVALAGNYACLADGPSGLQVIDITEPARLLRNAI